MYTVIGIDLTGVCEENVLRSRLVSSGVHFSGNFNRRDGYQLPLRMFYGYSNYFLKQGLFATVGVLFVSANESGD
jgi:hypothetical protein